MAAPSGVISTQQVLQSASKDFESLVKTQRKARTELIECDKTLYNTWYGVAGDAFMLAADTILEDFGIRNGSTIYLE